MVATQAAGASFECLIEPWQTVEIRSPVEGILDKINVQRGDTVRKGQVLVELQSGVERAVVESARYRAQMVGRVMISQARLDLAGKKLSRAKDLNEHNFVAAQALDEAQAERRLAEADLRDAIETQESAKLEYRRAAELLNQRTISSPLNGVVVDRMLNVGDLAEAGTGRKPVLKLAQIDPLRVDIVLPAALFGQVHLGQHVNVKATGTTDRHDAVVRIVDRVVDAASGTFVVRLDLPNPSGAIAGGVRCQAALDAVLPRGTTNDARASSQP
jgi:RND family efflux transporter MFP subunit